MKNSMTPSAIEQATFRFVAQHLNHCATAVSIQFIAEVHNATDYIQGWPKSDTTTVMTNLLY
jgi:hypothetical protein